MGLTAFNRARRLAAERLAQQQAPAPVQAQPESATVADLTPAKAPLLTREARIEQLQGNTWEMLRDLLREYGLPTTKPKGLSWDDFAIPQILKHEGF